MAVYPGGLHTGEMQSNKLLRMGIGGLQICAADTADLHSLHTILR